MKLGGMAIIVLLAALAPAVAEPARSGQQGPVTSVIHDQSQDQPVQIEAATLEVRDKNKIATFSGDVQVVQGDTTMKCQTLVVFYGQEIGLGGDKHPPPAPAAKPGTMNQQHIRRIEARGGVTVTSKDQNASGDLGVYDLKTKTITLTGNVVVSQGQNVIHGEQVVVDTVTGNARVESSNAGAAPSRVRAVIMPGKGENGAGTSDFLTIGPGPGRPN